MILKFFIFAAAAISLIVYSLHNPNQVRLELLGNHPMQIFSTCDVSHPLITHRTDLGFAFIYHTDTRHAATVRPLFNRIDGESITLYNACETEILRALNHTVVQIRESTTRTVYAYSPLAGTFITHSAGRITLQISTRGNRTVVGWPVILGSW